MLELENKIEFGENVQPVQLIGTDQQVKDNTTCLITGWGRTNTNESKYSLRGVEIPTYNQEKCNRAYERFNYITSSMLCAGYDKEGKGICKGNKH